MTKVEMTAEGRLDVGTRVILVLILTVMTVSTTGCVLWVAHDYAKCGDSGCPQKTQPTKDFEIAIHP